MEMSQEQADLSKEDYFYKEFVDIKTLNKQIAIY